MVEPKQIEQLLSKTKVIIKHQREIERLKGENFNVFSILKMESRENETHSAFIKELLNPIGSHLKGSLFLKLFLNEIDDSSIDEKGASVEAEHFCGKRNDIDKEGGRIDIYIWDKKGNSISIENKIYAGDQNAQIERYCQYRKGKNKVYYLTLYGEEPSDESKGKLIDGEDYYCISYKNVIQDWLSACIKEAADEPILRESIKQYLILIKKLTATMDSDKQNELISLMLRNSEEAEYISANYNKAILDKAEEVRSEVAKRLRNKLGESYTVWGGHPTHRHFSQVWIKIADIKKSNLLFGVESFNGNGNGIFKSKGLFVGIHSLGGKPTKFAENNKNIQNSKWWYNASQIKGFENDSETIDLSNPKLILKLYNQEGYFNNLVNHIVTQVKDYIKNEEDSLRKFIQNN